MAPERLTIGTDVADIVYVVGAAATHVELVQAIVSYQAAIRASLIAAPGLGVDQRSGELVAIVSARDEFAGPLIDPET
ncbi:MAG: hypothetical protein EOP67_69905, partial [Sphingomonas sp.]